MNLCFISEAELLLLNVNKIVDQKEFLFEILDQFK